MVNQHYLFGVVSYLLVPLVILLGGALFAFVNPERVPLWHTRLVFAGNNKLYLAFQNAAGDGKVPAGVNLWREP